MNTLLRLSNGVDFRIYSITGEVVADRKWSETEVSSSPTVGFHHAASGITYGGGQEVSSQTSNKKEFWLRTMDGTEKEVTLVDFPVSYRSGHVLTVSWGAKKDAPDGLCFAVYNHSTRQENLISHTPIQFINFLRKTGIVDSKYRLLQGIIIAGLIFSIIGIPIFIIWMIIATIYNKKVTLALREEILSAWRSGPVLSSRPEAESILAARQPPALNIANA